MDRLAQELKERLDGGIPYHLPTGACDWMIVKLEGMSMYTVMCNAESPAHFKHLEDACAFLLMQIGLREDLG